MRIKLHPDFSDFIKILNKNSVEYVIVGSFALAFHGFPRATGDIDIWIRPTLSNAIFLINAIKKFGFKDLDISEEDILSGKIIQLGYPPVRIDILTVLDGLNSDEIWEAREMGHLGPHKVAFIGKRAFIKNKQAIGRHKDLADIESLGEKI